MTKTYSYDVEWKLLHFYIHLFIFIYLFYFFFFCSGGLHYCRLFLDRLFWKSTILIFQQIHYFYFLFCFNFILHGAILLNVHIVFLCFLFFLFFYFFKFLTLPSFFSCLSRSLMLFVIHLDSVALCRNANVPQPAEFHWVFDHSWRILRFLHLHPPPHCILCLFWTVLFYIPLLSIINIFSFCFLFFLKKICWLVLPVKYFLIHKTVTFFFPLTYVWIFCYLTPLLL